MKRHLLTSACFLLLLTAAAQQSSPFQQAKERLAEGNIEDAEAMLTDLDTGSWQYIVISSEILQRKGRSDQAAEQLDNYMNASPELPDEALAQVYNEWGMVMWNQGNYNEARQYLLRALEIYEEKLPDQKEAIAGLYNNLGLVESAPNPQEAETYYTLAMDAYEEVYGANSARLAQLHNNLGLLALRQQSTLEAEYEFDLALQIYQNIYPGGHPNTAFTLVNLGRAHQLEREYSEAETLYRKAIEMYRQAYGEHHPDLASVFNQMANMELEQRHYDAALVFVQQAFRANIPSYSAGGPEANPPLDGYYHPQVLMNSLLYKARTHYRYFRDFSLKMRDINYSLETLSRCEDLLERMRQQSQDEQDKIALGALANEVYTQGVRVAYAGYLGAFFKKDYREDLFGFIEKSKSAVLLQAINDTKAKAYAGVPETLLEKEKQLKAEMAYYQRQIASRPDDDELPAFRAALLELQQDYENFVADLEQQYPEYYALKFEAEVPSLATIQAQLDNDQMLASYFLDEVEQTLYQVMVSPTKTRIERVAYGDRLQRYMAGFRNGILYRLQDIYSYTGHELYKILFPGGIPASCQRLVVVPSGNLGSVAFEALLLSSPGEEASYAGYPYLVKRTAVQYAYSAALWRNEPDQEHRIESALLMAPVSFEALPDLPNTEQEVRQIQAMLSEAEVRTQSHLRSEAQRSLILNDQIKDYDCIHLATHGLVDERTPALSKVYFGGSEDEEGVLYAGDVYSMELGAHLVTLSACQTALGQVQRGEGIIGLSRALLYAGADRLVVSLWSVDDLGTALLMSQFYRNLTQGMSYAEALSGAKNYLILHDHPEPYFWAPFILID